MLNEMVSLESQSSTIDIIRVLIYGYVVRISVTLLNPPLPCSIMRFSRGSQRHPIKHLPNLPIVPCPERRIQMQEVITYVREEKRSTINCFRSSLSAHPLLFAKPTSLPAHLYSQRYLQLENLKAFARWKKHWNHFSYVPLLLYYTCHLIETGYSCNCSHSSLASLVAAVEPLQEIRRGAVSTVVSRRKVRDFDSAVLEVGLL